MGATAGPDDAGRRGPPARRRPLAHPRLDRPQRPRPTTRPSPTSSRRSSATASSGCTVRSPRTSSTTSRSTTRTTRSRPARGRRPTRTSCAACTASRRRPSIGKDAHPARLVGSGSILQQVIAARDLLAEQVRRRGRGVQRAVLPAAAPRRARGRALEPPPSRTPRPHGCPYVSRSCPRTAARSWPPPTG